MQPPPNTTPQHPLSEPLSPLRHLQLYFHVEFKRRHPKRSRRCYSLPSYEAAEILLSLMSPEEAEVLIVWALEDIFWSGRVLTLKNLVEHLKAIEKSRKKKGLQV